MKVKDKVSDLVHRYRMLFMNEGEDHGEEILVSMLSQKCALISVDEILSAIWHSPDDVVYWKEVKREIENL